MKRFNVTGKCIPEQHYMADTGKQMIQIKELVDLGDYFTINRARQYGKTTTLNLLERKLEGEYLVLFISFEGVGEAFFSGEIEFVKGFQEILFDAMEFQNVEPEILEAWRIEKETPSVLDLNRQITWLCRTVQKKVVLLIDEVDKSSNNQLFLDFLGILRDKYLNRDRRPTFHSVVLAGVYDVKNLKLKLRPDEETNRTFSNVSSSRSSAPLVLNSPWNIAVNFDVDMSLNVMEIASMLESYEEDHHTGMDVPEIARTIHEYTSGYPFLVSRICLELATNQNMSWSVEGVQKVVKLFAEERNALFDDITKNLENNEELYKFMYSLLITGVSRAYVPGNPVIDLASTFSFIRKEGGKVRIHNKIFEMIILNYFISKEEGGIPGETNQFKNEVTKEGALNLELCMKRFGEHFDSMYGKRDIKFLERECKLLFLTYLKPLINGIGFYELETQTADERRLDVVLIYGRHRYIIELKLWYGESSHGNAYQQLLDYMEAKNEQAGYLLTFDFRKKKEPSSAWVEIEGKRIFDVVV